ncbi:MAG: hypothetical protein JWM15_2795 [Cryptosporangiaceae bacterium]|nr:hypothetical protein [Cryptosporangiaceae bacterium]
MPCCGRYPARYRDPVEIRPVGPVEVRVGGAPKQLGPRQDRLLLALLALHAGDVVTTARIAEILGDGEPPRTFPEATCGCRPSGSTSASSRRGAVRRTGPEGRSGGRGRGRRAGGARAVARASAARYPRPGTRSPSRPGGKSGGWPRWNAGSTWISPGELLRARRGAEGTARRASALHQGPTRRPMLALYGAGGPADTLAADLAARQPARHRHGPVRPRQGPGPGRTAAPGTPGPGPLHRTRRAARGRRADPPGAAGQVRAVRHPVSRAQLPERSG